MSISSRRRPAPPPITPASPIELRARGDFISWLEASRSTLAVTTYNSGKLALFSAPRGELQASYWSFPRPMGLAVSGQRLGLAARDHFWHLHWSSDEEAASDPSRRLIRVASVIPTGRIDTHDVAYDLRGPLFVNTRFNCIARPSKRAGFKPIWIPAFMRDESPMQQVDCCHLNGLGLQDGLFLGMATAFCDRPTPAAWRAGDRFQSGVLIDVRRNRIVLRGLCLPHSPRWFAGEWWLCDSGRGVLAAVDVKRDRYESVIELPGFTRGLTFAAGRAIVGLSRIRKRHILDAPPVRDRWRRLRSGVSLVDCQRGVETGALEFVRGGREVYDVAFLPFVTAPTFAADSAGG
jgi:uncharacterized protein (TIGR03032 family)